MASTAESSQADPAGPTTPRVAEFELARPIASDEAIQSAHNHHNTHNHYYPTTAASYAPRRTPRRAVQRDGHGDSMLMDSVETRRSTSGRPASRGAAVPLMAEISSSSLAWPAASHLSSRGGGHSSRDSSRRSGMVAFSTVSHSHATTPTSSARREAHDGSHPSRRVVPPPPPLLAADAWIASAPPQQLDASALAPLSSWCSATQQQPPPPPGWMDALRGEAEKLPREELLELVEQGRLDVRVRRANVERQRATLEALHAGVRQNVVSADHNQEEITNGLLRRIDVVQRHKKSLHKRLNAQLRERAKLEVKLASTTAAIAEMHSHLREEEGGPTQQRMEEQLGYLTDQRQQLETILEEHTLSLQELEHLVKEAQDKGGLGGGGSGSFDSTSSSLAATPTVPVCAPLPSVVPPPPPPPLDTHGREAMADYLSQAITMVEALQEEAMERSAAYANKKVELEQRVLECEHTMATRHQDVELMSQELREVNQAAVYRATTREQELELRVEALVHGGRGGLALAHSLSQTGSTSNLSTPKLRGQHMPPPQQGSPATATLLLDDESTVSTTISRSLYSPNSNAGGGGRLSRCASATASSGGRRPPAHPSLVREIAPPLALPHAALSSTRATDSHTHLLPGEGRASPALAIPSPQPRSGSQMSVQETRRMSAPRPLSSAECTPKRSPRMRAPERRSISPME